MAKFWFCAAVGFYLSQLCLAQIGLNISCRYAGVFHVEKNHRYSLTREEAVELCKALNSTIPTSDQMQKAFDLGFETCRYGYIEDKVVVPRHTPYHLCAANNTGVYILTSNISERYDTYCFNLSEARDQVCDPVTKLYSTWPNNESTIEIFNADGSRYIEGEKYTDRPPVTEDEISAGSGSANDRATTEPNFIRHGVSKYPHSTDGVITPHLIAEDDEHSKHHGEEDQHPKSTTAVVLNKDIKHEDSSHDSLLHGIHSGEASEIIYSTNGTREDGPPGTDLLGDNEHFSATTAFPSSDDFFKQEDSNQHPQNGGHSGLDIGDTVPTATTMSDPLHRGLVPSSEKGSMLEKGDFHHTVKFSNETVGHEEADEDHLSVVGMPERRNEGSSATNRTINDAIKILTSPNEYDHENEPSQTVVVATNETNNEDSTNDTLIHGIHFVWSHEDRHPSNTSGEGLLPGVASTIESKHEEDFERSHTVVLFSTGGKYEDSTQDPMTNKPHPARNSEFSHPGNTSTDDLVPGIVLPTENVHAMETSHTVLVHNDYEDSTKQPIHPTHQPGWDTEEKYLTNASRDDVLVDVDMNSNSEHDLSFTDVVSGGTKEDPTLEPVRQWGSEDKYTTQSPVDILVPGIVPRRGINKKNKTDHTAVVSSDGAKSDGSTQYPSVHGLHPGVSNEGDINITEDYRIPGIFSEVDSDSDRHSSTSSDSSKPDEHGRGGSHTGKNITPLPGEPPKSQPRRAHIPDWLIVVASLLALSLILGVCIAVNSRRRCGQKKKLVINNGKGGIDEKNMGGLNGEASKSHEMVHLVHKEKPEDQRGSHDEFLAIDETQNQQDVALKSGM